MRRTARAVALALGLALILAGCQRDESAGVGAGNPASTPPPPTPSADGESVESHPPPAAGLRRIRIAFVSGLGSLPVYAARKNQWFAEHGFEATFSDPRPDSDACLALLASGDVDAAYGVSLVALLDRAEKEPGAHRILAFAAETQKNPFGAFLVPRDSPVRAIEELRSKRVSAAGADYAAAMAELALTGQRAAEVNAIPLITIPKDRPIDFAAPDSPEAVFGVGPVMAGLTKGLPGARAARTVGQAPLAQRFFSPFPVQAVVIRGALVRDDPAVARDFARANDALLDWCNRSFAETLPLLQAEFGLDDESTLNLYAPLFVRTDALAPDLLVRAGELWTGRSTPDGEKPIIPGLLYSE